MKREPEIATTSSSPVMLPRWSAWRKTRGMRVGSFVALFAVLVVLPALLSDYYIYLAAQVMIYAIATLGLDIVYGRAGQLSLAHASFFGLGAYTAALSTSFSVPFWLQPFLVVALAVMAGAVVAVPTLRLSGLRLALVTLLFGELFTWAINHTGDLTGGSEGMTVPPLTVGAFDSSNPVHIYALAAIVSVLATLLCSQLGRTQYGRRMLAVRDSELASQAIGVPIVKTKIVAFILAAAFAGIAGWLYAYAVGFISPTTFDLFGSVYFLVAVILGGSGKVLGAWLGALYIVLIPDVFTAMGYPNLFPILGGGVLIAVALLLPGGLVDGATQLLRMVTRTYKGGSAGSGRI
jgi:branched-chain amino acid transport system permease protein